MCVATIGCDARATLVLMVGVGVGSQQRVAGLDPSWYWYFYVRWRQRMISVSSWMGSATETRGCFVTSAAILATSRS